MFLQPHLSPSGRFSLRSNSDDCTPEASSSNVQEDSEASCLFTAFSASHAEGFELLASSRFLHAALPFDIAWLRDLSHAFFTALCHTPPPALPQPSSSWASSWIASAPPFPGLEYLDEDVVRQSWASLAERAANAYSSRPDGLAGYLNDLNPAWHSVGRVTFHLAENKRRPDLPFAFLATYTHSLSASGSAQHLPLGRALQEYASADHRDTLARLLEPVRRAADSSPLARELLESRALFQPQLWSPAQAYRFLREIPALEDSGLSVRIPDWWSSGKPPRPQVSVRIGEKRAAGVGADALLDFKIELSLDGEELTDEERRTLLEASSGLILLKGRWIEVDRERLGQVLDYWRSVENATGLGGLSLRDGLRMLAGFTTFGDGAGMPDTDLARDEWSRVRAGSWLADAISGLHDPQTEAASDPGPDLHATLRPYQRVGVRWLFSMHRLGMGACLADDMGLGKTIQVIGLLLALKKETSDRGNPSSDSTSPVLPSLLIAPASLLANWKSELARFAPTLRPCFLHASETPPEKLAAFAAAPEIAFADTDLVLVTYGMALRLEWLGTLEWRMVILDEAQAIRNPNAGQTRAVKALRARQRLALTGTPIENSLSDLWSLFDFLNPGLLGGASQFTAMRKRQESRQGERRYTSLRRLVRPLMLRRLKTDRSIIADLPDKTELDTFCPLSPVQATLYQEAVADLARRLADPEVEGIQRRGIVLSFLTRFKQICNHPSHWLGDDRWDPTASGKFARLREIALEISERQEKMLLFTQYRAIADPLARFISSIFGRDGLVLDGSTPVRERQQLVSAFQQDDGPPFFVLSLKAGGTGLNLTAASHVVHFDRWWNPAVENQATDRAFRIGQKKNVMVHKFICRGTLEEKIHALIAQKTGLADDVLGEGPERLLTEMSADELMRFVALDSSTVDAD